MEQHEGVGMPTKLLELCRQVAEHHGTGGGVACRCAEAHKSVNLNSTFGLNWLDAEPWPLNLLTKSMLVGNCAVWQIGLDAHCPKINLRSRDPIGPIHVEA